MSRLTLRSFLHGLRRCRVVPDQFSVFRRRISNTGLALEPSSAGISSGHSSRRG
jgi:hypothetical protein